MIALFSRWVRSGLSSFFSSRIEDSFRLRLLTLAGLWTAAMGLVWVGGDLEYCLAGGALGTVGHWFSYKMRNRPSRLRPLLISVAVIAISVYLRNDMVKSFNGDWLPLGQYLVLVSGLASYDLRTRGGLYTGLILSGMVLFFASQQAFDPSFGVFVVAFVVVLLAFLVMTFLEDMIRAAKTYWTKNQVATLVYWTGAICAMFLLAGLAFWILPRGDNNLGASPQLAVLPYSENDIQFQQPLQAMDLENSALSDPSIEGPAGQGSSGETDGPGGTGGVQNGGTGPADETDAGVEEFGDNSKSGPEETTPPVYTPDNSVDPASADQQSSTAGGENSDDPVVLHVRSSVASYWRGLVLEEFDGARWSVPDLNNKMIESPSYKGTWFNSENEFSNANVNYRQIFFLRGNDELPMVTGYRALQVVVNDEQTDEGLLASGQSYKVISSMPKHTPDQLRRDASAGLSPFLTILPEGLEQDLSQLAETIGAGASSDFAKVGRIISYLNAETELVSNGQTGLSSAATLDEFLFQGTPGSILDYATATVMLARASGLPARLAVGYLPGVKDPLTGTYRVRESDRHAWTEIQFADNGWVPFDGAPRGELAFGRRQSAGLSGLFASGVGDDVYASLKDGPKEAFQTLVGALPGPLLSILVPAIAVVVAIGRWLQIRPRRRNGGPGGRSLAYAAVPGQGKREMKKLYAEVERLIRRKVGVPRASSQTAADYASFAANRSPELDEHISWFKQAVWRAAYRSGDLQPELITDGRVRLALFKKAFQESFKDPGRQQASVRSQQPG